MNRRRITYSKGIENMFLKNPKEKFPRVKIRDANPDNRNIRTPKRQNQKKNRPLSYYN